MIKKSDSTYKLLHWFGEMARASERLGGCSCVLINVCLSHCPRKNCAMDICVPEGRGCSQGSWCPCIRDRMVGVLVVLTPRSWVSDFPGLKGTWHRKG